MFDSYPPTSNNSIISNSQPNISISSENRAQMIKAGIIMKVVVDDDDAAAIKRSVKAMNFGDWTEKAAAAVDIKRLAEGDVRTRRLLAELGVVPSLVAMVVDANDDDRIWKLAVDALVEMANGSYRNKKLMVEAGLLSKLPLLMRNQSLAGDRQFAHLLLSISSLANTQFPVDMQHILPFVIDILNSDQIDDDVKLTCISTLQNLSTKLENTRPIATSGAVHALLVASTDKKASEGALATLGNLILSAAGKKSIEDDPLVPKNFIEILGWEEKPKCQELAAYLLMIIAHRSMIQRQKMTALGIVPVLLEVALLGSPIVRKRALKLLEWFKDAKQMRMGSHSGPQARRVALAGNDEAGESWRDVKKMVRQSLKKNMESIMMRCTGDDVRDGLKVLAAISSSKSLPY